MWVSEYVLFNYFSFKFFQQLLRAQSAAFRAPFGSNLIFLNDSLIDENSLKVELFSYVFWDFHRSHDDWFLMAVASASHD